MDNDAQAMFAILEKQVSQLTDRVATLEKMVEVLNGRGPMHPLPPEVTWPHPQFGQHDWWLDGDAPDRGSMGGFGARR